VLGPRVRHALGPLGSDPPPPPAEAEEAIS
jgi:hypothetical protein